MKTPLTIILAVAAASAMAQDRTYGLSEPYYSQLLTAHQLYRSNDATRAVGIYTNMMNAPIPFYHKWLMLERIGDWTRGQSNYVKAIAWYSQILDYAHTYGPIDTNYLRGYEYNCHNCCIKVAECYEMLGDLSNAVAFAALSLSYPAPQFCALERPASEKASNLLNRLNRKVVEKENCQAR